MNGHEYGFDTEFTTDAEVEAMLDGIINAICDNTSHSDIQASIINPYRIQEVLYTYKMLKYITKGTRAEVTYKLHSPFKSMGCVSIKCKDLTFTQTRWFLKAVELASNFEVYPRVDGIIQMNFTFHGLTEAIS